MARNLLLLIILMCIFCWLGHMREHTKSTPAPIYTYREYRDYVRTERARAYTEPAYGRIERYGHSNIK